MSNCHHTRFVRWSHHVHHCLTMWDGVGQQTPQDLVRSCDECCAVGYFVLLSLVQRHTLVLAEVWRKTRIVNAYFCAREISRLRQQICVPLCKKIRMNSDHTAHWSMIERLDIVEPHVLVLCVPRFGCVVLREDCLAHRAPFGPKSNRNVPMIELQVEGQLVCTRTFGSTSNVRAKISSRHSERGPLEFVLPPGCC